MILRGQTNLNLNRSNFVLLLIFINQLGCAQSDPWLIPSDKVIFLILGIHHSFVQQHTLFNERQKDPWPWTEGNIKAFLCLKIVLSKKLFLFNTFWMKSLNETNEPHEKSQLFFSSLLCKSSQSEGGRIQNVVNLWLF